ncbi:MAG: hypothetical protein NPIRA02_26990 [Nitrospirales bacterium]|nr:MAG: hypothetical protein NPIRA02_26990 [Nitrospirales bacterium]
MSDPKKEYFPIEAYIKGQKKKVGYAYMTERGSLCIRADEVVDAAQVGRLMKKHGLYSEELGRKIRKNECSCAADDYDTTFNNNAA